MTRILDPEVLAERARNLGAHNGLRQLFVTLEPPGAPTHAWLDLEFFNPNHLTPLPPLAVFGLRGGTRRRAGTAPGEVQIVQIDPGASANTLRLKVEPVGDYSTYRLTLPPGDFDPLFSELPFKFRPGCFNLNCAPEWTAGTAPARPPDADYLAKDYDSFRHLIMTALARRVPGWEATSEADFDQVLIDLIAAQADELSDFQDRVMNEAYLASARKRVSLARHARLVDYHVHQGNQSSTWLAMRVAGVTDLPATAADELALWTGPSWRDADSVMFALPRLPPPADGSGPPRWRRRAYEALNTLQLYTWGGVVTALEAGTCEAELTRGAGMSQADADALRDLLLGAHADQAIAPGSEDVAVAVDHLLIEQALNPDTGTPNGRDVSARQILQLVPRDASPPRAESVVDPATGAWMVRVRWRAADALRRRYCFITRCTGQPPIENVCRFHGNLTRVAQGRPHRTRWLPPGSTLAAADESAITVRSEAAYAATRAGVLAPLPYGPLAYRDTPPGGDTPPRSSVQVEVSGFATPWSEQIDLIESQDDDEHFLVETDELGFSALRFGSGINGVALPDGAAITARYQVGQGAAGNIGADALTGFDAATAPGLEAVWNPLDVVNGRDPEAAAEIIRNAPEAHRQRQRRAVTLADYARMAESVEGVSHARARYGWTGSWRTVRVVIDPQGTTELAPELRERVAALLEAVRLIGEDVELRPAAYVPLDLELRVCVHPQYWPEHVRLALEMEFSDGYTADGRHGFFHPDVWSFGQPLHASQVIGRALAVEGLDRVLSLSMRRWDPGRGGGLTTITLSEDQLPESLVERIEVGAFEIVRVANDPNDLERGRIRFDLRGGRR